MDKCVCVCVNSKVCVVLEISCTIKQGWSLTLSCHLVAA